MNRRRPRTLYFDSVIPWAFSPSFCSLLFSSRSSLAFYFFSRIGTSTKIAKKGSRKRSIKKRMKKPLIALFSKSTSCAYVKSAATTIIVSIVPIMRMIRRRISKPLPSYLLLLPLISGFIAFGSLCLSYLLSLLALFYCALFSLLAGGTSENGATPGCYYAAVWFSS